jgi:hypothetical protein
VCPAAAGALGAVDRLLGLTEGPFQGEAGRDLLYKHVFDKVCRWDKRDTMEGKGAPPHVCGGAYTHEEEHGSNCRIHILSRRHHHHHDNHHHEHNHTITQCFFAFVDKAADRYAPAGKALRLVEHHASFFQRQLTAKPRGSYDKMHMVYARATEVCVWCVCMGGVMDGCGCGCGRCAL